MAMRIVLALNICLITHMIALTICFADEAVDRFRMSRVKARAEAYIEEGRRDIERGAYLKAIRTLSVALNKGAGNEAYELRARAYEAIGSKDLALKDLDRAIASSPTGPSGYITRADALNSMRYYDQAISNYNLAVELDPFHVDAYLGRGTAYAAMEDFELAIRDFELALKIDQHDPEALYNMAMICMIAGLPEAGRDFVHKALTVNSDSADRDRLFAAMSSVPERSDYEEKIGGIKGVLSELAREKNSNPVNLIIAESKRDNNMTSKDQTKNEDSGKSHRRAETLQALAKIGKEDFSGTSFGVYMGMKWSVSFRVSGKTATGTLKIVTPSGKEKTHHGRGTFENGAVEASDHLGFRFKGRITDDLKLVGYVTTADGKTVSVDIPLDQ